MSLDDDLGAFFASLADAYGSGDVDAVAEHFALPLMLVTADGTMFIEDDDGLDGMIAGVLAAWRANGITRATPVLGTVVPLPDDAARATVGWTREAADGTAVLRFNAIYTLAADEGEWRIVVLDATDEARARTGGMWN